MQDAGTVLAVLRERGREDIHTTPSRTRHKSPESPVHRKVPAGFGGGLRGKGPPLRDLAAQPILLLQVLGQRLAQVIASCADWRSARPAMLTGPGTPGPRSGGPGDPP